MYLYAGLAADLDDFLHAVQNGVGLAALVDDEYAVVLRNHLAHLDDLLALGVSAGNVDQAGGQTHGARFHLTAGNVLHLLDLFIGGQAVVQAHGLHADVAVGHQVHLVQAGMGLLDHLQVVVSGLIGPVDLVGIAVQTGQVFAPRADVLGGQRSHGHAVLAQQLGGDALHDLGQHLGPQQHIQVAVAVGVDEAGGHGQARRVDHLIGRLGDGADGGDLAVLHQHIGVDAGSAGAVDHAAVFDEHSRHGSNASLFLMSDDFGFTASCGPAARDAGSEAHERLFTSSGPSARRCSNRIP